MVGTEQALHPRIVKHHLNQYLGKSRFSDRVYLLMYSSRYSSPRER